MSSLPLPEQWAGSVLRPETMRHGDSGRIRRRILREERFKERGRELVRQVPKSPAREASDETRKGRESEKQVQRLLQRLELLGYISWSRESKKSDLTDRQGVDFWGEMSSGHEFRINVKSSESGAIWEWGRYEGAPTLLFIPSVRLSEDEDAQRLFEAIQEFLDGNKNHLSP